MLAGGGWLIGKLLGNFLFPRKETDFDTNYKSPPTIINNYTTEQHLHISKEDLEKLKK